MPKSRRDKKVSLTRTAGKGRDQKAAIMGKLRDTLDTYTDLYVFSYDHMRSAKFKDVRIEWRDSRFFMGKNKVMQKALGLTPEDEYRDNVRHLSKCLTGQVGLLATSRPKDDVIRYFNGFSVPDFAKAGAPASKSITLLPKDRPLQFFPSSMFNLFRKLGLNLEIKDGVLELLEPYVAAQEGTALTPEQAKVMALLDTPLVDFKIRLLCRWSDGEFEELDDGAEAMEQS